MFHPEDGGSKLLSEVGIFMQDDMLSHHITFTNENVICSFSDTLFCL